MIKMLGFLFSPLVVFQPVIAVSIFSIIILILINLCYKFFANQGELKQIKERIKEMNAKMKEEQKNGKPEEAHKILSEVMKENSKIMKMNIRPMLISFVVIILFLPWLASTYGDLVITIEDNKGDIEINGQAYAVQKTENTVNIVGESTISCEMPCRENIENNIWNIIEIGNDIKLERIVALLPVSLPLFGDDLGWLGWYFISSVPIIITIRKLFKINA